MNLSKICINRALAEMLDDVPLECGCGGRERAPRSPGQAERTIDGRID